ncbi:hypothetical protein PIB30_055975, partial [Stylosanthes scabra]|nr:hypothetical protein [Stylosanthes scabra]
PHSHHLKLTFTVSSSAPVAQIPPSMFIRFVTSHPFSVVVAAHPPSFRFAARSRSLQPLIMSPFTAHHVSFAVSLSSSP